MKSVLCLLALTGASKALQSAREVLLASGHYQAAECVLKAGWLVESAVGLVVVDKSKAVSS